ncbi:MAG: hydroxyacylglutathione hydrolase [Gammaproteobacteria bacterium]|nr:hydroxyacylglutathione hydrolase [Gammaproteobacteria bacterium]
MIEITAIRALETNYIWAIIDHDSRRCALIDPGAAEPANRFLAEQHLKLGAILITHHHWDHVNGIEGILAQHSAPVYGPSRETIPLLTNPMADNSQLTLELGIELTVLELPGHTLGQVAYWGAGAIFTGDTLFSAGCGRMFEGTPEQFWHSLERLIALPDHTQLYCGHEYTLDNLAFARTVEPDNHAIGERILQCQSLTGQNLPTVPIDMATEKKTNPFLRCQQPTVIDAAEAHANRELPSAAEVFHVLRSWKDGFRP